MYPIGLIFFAVLKTEVITIAYLIMRRNKFLKILFYVFWWAECILSVVNFGGVELYGFGISTRLMNVILQTNIAEIRGFMPGMFHNLANGLMSVSFFTGLIGLIAMGFIIKRCGNLLFNTLTFLGSLIGIVYYLFYISNFGFNRINHFTLIHTLKCYVSVVESEREFARQISELRELPYKESIALTSEPCNILLIIGESAARNHHSVYGYPLPTTPNIEALKDSIGIYRDVVGSSASTGDCVPKILTFESDIPHSDSWCDYPSIFQIFNQAGAKTYWFSNQDRVGNNKGTYSVIASRASTVRYIGSENVSDHMNARFDEELLPEVRKAMDDSAARKLITLHLFGSHTRYADRYPEAKSKFKASDILGFNHKKWVTNQTAKTIAEYDNTILYTDFVLGEIIKMIKASPEPYVMIYVSDHGENVYDDRNFIGRDKDYVDVPMYLYMNDKYRALRPEMDGQVNKSLTKKISSSMIINAVMTLSGIRYAMYNPAEDFLNDNFRERIRYSDDEPVDHK